MHIRTVCVASVQTVTNMQTKRFVCACMYVYVMYIHTYHNMCGYIDSLLYVVELII